jgi:ankyrin repeat protein
MLYLTHEPQQPLEDLRQEIEALREQTSDLESSPPMLSETQDNNQLLVLARDTVADGETIYAHSIDGGSISGNTLKTTSGRQSFLASWLHRQVLEASQHAIASVMEFDDVSITSRAFGDSSLKATDRVRWNRVDTVKYHEEANDELILERDLINTLFSSARVAFDKENYQDAKVGLQRTIATIHDFFPDACSIVDLFELQYMVAVATFYTTQARYAQTVLLEFLRQQGTSDRQRSRIAHASQLLAELYVTTGRLEAARSSCTNALRVHHYLTDSDNSLRYRCLALAARIETLSGNSVRADAYMYSINADDMEDYIGQYSHLITSKSLSTEQRTALSIRDATMFHGFSVNESNGTPKVIAAQNDPLDHSNSSMTLLHFAAIFRDTEYASTLIEGGADVNARAILPWSTSRWCDGNGLTPLKCAFLAGDENMTRLLVSNGASLQHPDTAGDLADVLLGDMPTEVETPSTVGQMLKCVVRLGWNIDSIINSHRQTLLHAATAMGNMELMKLLVSLGSSLKLEDKYGRMPLQTFGGRRALEQHLEIRDLLLQREPLTRLDNQDEGRMVPHPTFGSDTGRGVSELARCLVTRESTSSSKISSGIFR